MSKKILVLPGDGIGQEVTASAMQILDFIIKKFIEIFFLTTLKNIIHLKQSIEIEQ